MATHSMVENNSDDLVERIKTGHGNELGSILGATVDRYGADLVQMQLFVLANGGGPSNPFATGCTPANELAEETPVQRLWQMCLYPSTVTLLVGESGAGKSSLVYNLVVPAALGQPAFGIPFEAGRPLRVLYIDPENSGQTQVRRLGRIGLGRPADLIFHSGDGVDLSDQRQIAALRQFIADEAFDVVILDPIANLFNTVNENDNSEAARQMSALTSVSRSTGACIIAIHHTGKETAGQTAGGYGRGASARLAAADVAMLLRARGKGDDDADDTFRGDTIVREDIVRLQVVKNRIEGRCSLYLQMAGEDRFLRSTFAAWQEAGRKSVDESRVDQCTQDVEAYLSDGHWRTRPAIYAAMAQEGYGQALTDAALKQMVASGQVSVQNVGGVRRYNLSCYPTTTDVNDPYWSE